MTMTLDGTNGVTFNDTSLQGAAASPYVLKNRLINGAMVIDQRNAGAAVTANDSYAVDRFLNQNDTDGTFSAQQDSSAPAGFVNSLKFTTATADASLGATQRCAIQHRIEGYNVSDLGWGTANAKTVTLSFWVKSSLTGTFGGALQNSAANRSYPFSYTISVANTWELKSVTVAGDTSGTWLTTNGIGLRIYFSLGMGSTYSGTANAWVGADNRSPTGAVPVISTLSATFYITGVQLEIGSTATPFERRLYDKELVSCQRYYQIYGAGRNGSPAYQFFGVLTFEGSTSAFGPVALKTSMRTQPTTTYSGSFTASYGTLGTLINDTNQSGPDIGMIGWNTGSGGASGSSSYLRANNSTATFISFSAEL